MDATLDQSTYTALDVSPLHERLTEVGLGGDKIMLTPPGDAARTLGVILLSPISAGQTWAIAQQGELPFVVLDQSMDATDRSWAGISGTVSIDAFEDNTVTLSIDATLQDQSSGQGSVHVIAHASIHDTMFRRAP